MSSQIDSLVQKLDLKPHPEGGYFKETYRSGESIKKEHLPERFSGDRSHSTAIYFLLTSNNFPRCILLSQMKCGITMKVLH